jgi:predicted ester cyclase
MYLTAFPDAHFVVEEQFVDGDTVVSRWSGTGTHNGELMGISPTGRKVAMTGILIDRIQHGKLIEQWANHDALGIFQQIGAIPRLPGTA